MTKTYAAYVLATLSLASAVTAHTAHSERDTSAVPRPNLGSLPYGNIITSCKTANTVALTYDDGPGPYTAQLLDLLAANGAKATFFLLGNAIQAQGSAIVQRMVTEGHQVASHTYDHQSLDSLTTAGRRSEMLQNEVIFTNALGYFPTYMRPPYGFCNTAVCQKDMKDLGYHVITWDVDTKDYENDSPSLIQNAKNLWDASWTTGATNYLPLTHDVHQNTVNTLAPYMIGEIKARGYKMVSVGDCLGDPTANWYRDPSTGYSVVNKAAQAPAANSTTVSGSTSASKVATTFVVAPTNATTLSSVTTTSSTITPAAATTATSATATPSVATTKSAGAQLTVSFMLYGFIAMLYMALHV